MPIKTVQKSLGVLLYPSGVFGGRVCGTFGKGAKEWIEKLISMGLNTGNFCLSTY